MIDWCLYYDIDFEVGIPMATSSWTLTPSWGGCENLLGDITGWDVEEVDVETDFCTEVPYVIDTDCMKYACASFQTYFQIAFTWTSRNATA